MTALFSFSPYSLYPSLSHTDTHTHNLLDILALPLSDLPRGSLDRCVSLNNTIRKLLLPQDMNFTPLPPPSCSQFFILSLSHSLKNTSTNNNVCMFVATAYKSLSVRYCNSFMILFHVILSHKAQLEKHLSCIYIPFSHFESL